MEWLNALFSLEDILIYVLTIFIVIIFYILLKKSRQKHQQRIQKIQRFGPDK